MNELATKDDLRKAMSELKAALSRQSLVTMAVLTVVFVIVTQ